MKQEKSTAMILTEKVYYITFMGITKIIFKNGIDT